MEVPRYRLDRQQPNNVASIWLLRGTAKHAYFRDFAAAIHSVLFHVRRLFRSNLSDSSQGQPKGSALGTPIAEM
jgi:hypothetical protein